MDERIKYETLAFNNKEEKFIKIAKILSIGTKNPDKR